MVVLETFMAVIGLGMVLWVAGAVLERPDVGLLGAIIVIGIAGSAVVGDGILLQVGVERVDTSTGAEINNIYEPISTMSDFPLDMLTLFAGSLLAFKSIGDMSEK